MWVRLLRQLLKFVRRFWKRTLAIIGVLWLLLYLFPPPPRPGFVLLLPSQGRDLLRIQPSHGRDHNSAQVRKHLSEQELLDPDLGAEDHAHSMIPALVEWTQSWKIRPPPPPPNREDPAQGPEHLDPEMGVRMQFFSSPDHLTFLPDSVQGVWQDRRRQESSFFLEMETPQNLLLGRLPDSPVRSAPWELDFERESPVLDLSPVSDILWDLHGFQDLVVSDQDSSNFQIKQEELLEDSDPAEEAGLLSYNRPFWIQVTSDAVVREKRPETPPLHMILQRTRVEGYNHFDFGAQLMHAQPPSFPQAMWINGRGNFGMGSKTWSLPNDCFWTNPPNHSWWLLRFQDWITRGSLDRVISLVQLGAGDYYHWFLESLPRLMLLPQAMWKDPGSPYKLLLQEPRYPKHQLQILEWLGIRMDRIEFLPGAHWTLDVQEELVIPQTCECMGCNPRILQEWRQYLFVNTPLKEFADFDVPRTAGRAQLKARPFVLRPNSGPYSQKVDFNIIWLQRLGRRSLDNEAELLEITKLVFPEANLIVSPGGQSLLDEVKLFRSGDLFIGPHGAAWTNLLWARPGFDCLEVLPQKYAVRMYDTLGRVFGGRSHRFLTAPGGTKKSTMTADPLLFLDALLDIRRNL